MEVIFSRGLLECEDAVVGDGREWAWDGEWKYTDVVIKKERVKEVQTTCTRVLLWKEKDKEK